MSIETTQESGDNLELVNNNIQNYGCHLVLIEANNYMPAFVYSIGLYKKQGHPEIICFGLKNNIAASIINHACDLIKNGETFTTGRLYNGFIEGFPIQFLQVNKEYYHHYVGYTGRFYDQTFNFPLLQLVWTDKQNNFPWDKDFNPDWRFKQPLLDRNTDFKFYEERNLGVYTTKQVFTGDPILYVYHDEEGDWQFHTKSESDLNDLILVCLEEITKLDSSINELFHLQIGWRAWRDNKNEEWSHEEYTADE